MYEVLPERTHREKSAQVLEMQLEITMEFRQDLRTRMKGGRWFSKEEYLMSMAEHHHEEEDTGIEEVIKNNKNFQNGFVALEDKAKKAEETEDG